MFVAASGKIWRCATVSRLWLVCDNLHKGAATNAVRIAEDIIERGAWLR